MKKLLSYHLTALIVILFLPFSVNAEIKGFQDFSGKTVSFESKLVKGKWTVVMIWASDCSVCNREAHQYVDFHTFHSEKDASVVGISIDGEEKLKEAKGFIKKHHIEFPNLIAEFETVARLYYELTGDNFGGTPTILLYSPEGELKAAQAGAVPAEIIEEFISKQSVKKATKKQ